MTRKISVVIGAGWGDEGKGLVTDWISNNKTLNVRYNGGAQAGHTVVTPEGDRHVFSHFGAGSFQGGRTLLADRFIVNPIFFLKEYNSFTQNRNLLEPYVDFGCPVTTPYDLIINQELVRNQNLKTSCGVGINETVMRNRDRRYQFHMRDLIDDDIGERLNFILERWVPERLEELKLGVPEILLDRLTHKRIIKNYIEDLQIMMEKIQLVHAVDIIDDWPNDIVFEGAQGLKLCMSNLEDYPFLTPSATGLDYVLPLLDNLCFPTNPDIYYVTRTYITRHGSGPMPHEYGKPPGMVDDETNVTNEFQGVLRYSILDMRVLAKAIADDYEKTSWSKLFGRFSKKLVLTCCDQTSGIVNFIDEHGFECRWPVETFRKMLLDHYKFDEVHTCYGPTRNGIRSQL